jgi:lipid II:glycine glycyltransferase (peptidoglycan interpeptide bridge formation enzyme)
MVKQFIKKGPITKTDYWFAKKIKPSFLSSYFQSSFDGKIFGMKRKENYTIHINLKDDLEVIKGKFDKGTAYEVRRAEKDGITMEIVHDKTEFVDFYNSFAKAKGLEGTSLEYNIL